MLNKSPKNEINQNSALNMIGVGTIIQGDLSSDGDLRIDGKIEGKVLSKSKIAMGAGAEIKGDVHARSADISGKIDGDITISETLFLRSSAKINGNIHTSKLVIESGAEFNGQCHMNSRVNGAKINN
ncbi:MAG: polymer-forming cytoskeletal protein [Bacteroidetes bacterium]|nr:polymer-forming cytoskeletal protein [Bacteroidota bacterium]